MLDIKIRDGRCWGEVSLDELNRGVWKSRVGWFVIHYSLDDRMDL